MILAGLVLLFWFVGVGTGAVGIIYLLELEDQLIFDPVRQLRQTLKLRLSEGYAGFKAYAHSLFTTKQLIASSTRWIDMTR